MLSIKDYADKKGISTQAVYKQLKIHKEQLEGHIITESGKRLLDDFAVDYLDKRTQENPVYVMDQQMKAENERLKAREIELLAKLDAKNDELNAKSNAIIQLQQKINQLVIENREKDKEIEVEKTKKWYQKLFK